MREPLIYKSEYWITQETAAVVFGRTPRTIRNWVKDGRVRTYKPLRTVWLYAPDLEECEHGKKKSG